MAETIDKAIDKPKESTATKPANQHAFSLDAPSIASSATDTIPAEEGKNSFVSTGAKMHKWGTYLGVDWIFNTLTGVSFSYWGKYTETGKKVWSGPVSNGFTKLLKPFIKHPETLKSSAGYGTMFMSIIAGGMFTIPPLMILEKNKNKRKITETLDTMVYGKEAVENDPKFKASYEEIETAPEKNFTSGLASRFVALSPLLAIVLIPASKRLSDKAWFNHVEAASEFTAKKAGFTAENLFSKVSPTEAKSRWKFIHENVAMDFGLGIPYAILHSVFYNKFAGKKEAAKAADEPKSTPASAPAEITAAEPTKQWAAQIEQKAPAIAAKKQMQNFTEKLAEKGEAERQMI